MNSLRDNYREDEDEEDGLPTAVPPPLAAVEPASEVEVPPGEVALPPEEALAPAEESAARPEETAVMLEKSVPPPEESAALPPEESAVPPEESVPLPEESAAPPEESPLPPDESAAPMEVDSAGGTESGTPATEPPSEDMSSDETEKSPKKRKFEEENGEEEEDEGAPKKQKQLSSLDTEPTEQQQEEEKEEEEEELGLEQEQSALPQEDANNGDIDADSSANATPLPAAAGVTGNGHGNGNSSNSKKSKKKSNNVWVTKSTRKGKKKKQNNNNQNTPAEEPVFITPVPRFPDKSDDSPDMAICLSKVYKAEKVELSDDRMSAGSTKGYRMVRATRGVVEGAWYFEIKVVNLGGTGHTRLGWSMEKGDLQAPVGYDANSFGYRDIDGSKVHKALREKYGEEGYKEGDVIGFYINLPDGEQYAPKQPQLVWYKGQRYVCAPDPKEDPPKVVPGSEISFFKNGICQGVAFTDLCGGRYYPAASMYTLPDQPNCVVKFNFGPEFEFFPIDFEGRPTPGPMVEAPYHGYDSRVENSVPSDKN